ncbi:MAG: hypothetical protein ACKVQR_10500 [Aquabacterium sp.]
MSAFTTLLLREWLQHRRGWLALMLVPLVLAVLVLAFGKVNMEFDDLPPGQLPDAMLLALMACAVSAGATMAIMLAAAYMTTPGLARRDYQDRSIEFWLSMPQGHVASLGAALLMQLVLIPMLALAVGTLGGQLLALLLVAKTHGISAWASLPLGSLVLAMLAVSLRLALGIALAALWLAPLVMLVMAACAWLKRWGLPVVVICVVTLGVVLDKAYQNTVVWTTLAGVMQNAGQALASANPGAPGLSIGPADKSDVVLAMIPGWALQDAGHALAALASMAFALGLLLAAVGFGLMVLRRSRGA